MAVEVFLHFNGNCREAVEFYAEVFGAGKPEFMTFGDAPDGSGAQFPDAVKKWVMYTQLKINGSTVMFSDTPPNMPVMMGNKISLTVSNLSREEIVSVFNRLRVGGQVIMELRETFWSKYYGMVIDQFGVPWHLNHMSKQVKP